MGFDISSFSEPIGFANTIYGITGQLVDSAIAAGYAEWVKGITGSLPEVQQVDAGHVKIVFTQAQIPLMRRWLDDQLKSSMSPSQAGPVTYDMGSVINMWAARYAIPTVIVIFAVGLAIGYFVHR